MSKTINTQARRDAQLDADLEAIKKAKNPDADLKSTPQDGEDLKVENKEDKSPLSGWDKRYSDLRSYSAKKENELKGKILSLETQLRDAAQKQIKFPKTEEEVTEWVSKYPDVAAIVETIAMKKVADVRAELQQDREALQVNAYKNEFDKNVNRILNKHSDFFLIREEPKFVEWLEKQPKYIKTVFFDDIAFEDLEDAADTTMLALEMFKDKHQPKKVDNKQDQRDAARDVGTRNSRSEPTDHDPNLIYESDIEKNYPGRKYTDAIDEAVKQAMRDGRFVYDLSGAAR